MATLPHTMDLKSYLTEHRLKPAAFARQVGVDRSTLGKILHGRRRAGPEVRRKIFEATAGAVTPTDLDGLGAVAPHQADSS